MDFKLGNCPKYFEIVAIHSLDGGGDGGGGGILKQYLNLNQKRSKVTYSCFCCESN